MTDEEQKLNWYAILKSGSMTAIHNIREYIKRLEKENAELKMKLLTLENKEQVVTTTVSN